MTKLPENTNEWLTEQDLKRAEELCEKAKGQWAPSLGEVQELFRVLPKLLDEIKRMQSLNDGELQAEVSRLDGVIKNQDAKIAEFIDGENHGEQYPPAP